MRRSRTSEAVDGREAAGPLLRSIAKRKNALSTRTLPERIKSFVWIRGKSAGKNDDPFGSCSPDVVTEYQQTSARDRSSRRIIKSY
jgi:hypothetical protein